MTRFSQNFLNNPSLIKQIVNLFAIKPNECIFEVGPGYLNITNQLKKYTNNLFLFQIDSKLVEYCKINLKKTEYKHIYLCDYSKYTVLDIKNILDVYREKSFSFYSSLPYHLCFTIIHLNIITNFCKRFAIIVPQKIGLKIINAQVNSKLRFLVSTYFKITTSMFIKNTNFVPCPNIHSMFLIAERIKNFEEDHFNLKFLTKLFDRPNRKLKQKSFIDSNNPLKDYRPVQLTNIQILKLWQTVKNKVDFKI